MAAPTEFQSVEGFYHPEEPGLFFSLSPLMLGGLVALLLLAGLIGWWMGKARKPSDDPTEKIYDAIKKAVGAAAGAPRDSVMASARRLKATIDENLGGVLTLAGGLSAPYASLGKALEGLDYATPHKPAEPDKEKVGIEKLVINARRVVVNTTHPVASEPAHDDDHGKDGDHGHDAHSDHSHNHGHGDPGHGSGKPLDAKAQVAQVRAAVHAFSDHWTDKSARLAELREARRLLTRGPS